MKNILLEILFWIVIIGSIYGFIRIFVDIYKAIRTSETRWYWGKAKSTAKTYTKRVRLND